MGKAIQHLFPSAQPLDRGPVIFLIQEKAGFLPVLYIDYIFDPVFGPLTFDFKKKKSYGVLRRLIKEEWTTKAAVQSAAQSLAFRGFYGKYKISYTAGGKSREIVLPLHENGVKEYRLEALSGAPKEFAND